MTDLQITLTDDERDYLANLLEIVLKDKRVEEHRTRAPTYREGIIHEEDLIIAVLRKISPAPR